MNASPAWFDTTVPVGAGAVIVARNFTIVCTPGESAPPTADVAPAPRRATSTRLADTQSTWSSPRASVFAPAFGPLTTLVEPAT